MPEFTSPVRGRPKHVNRFPSPRTPVEPADPQQKVREAFMLGRMGQQVAGHIGQVGGALQLGDRLARIDEALAGAAEEQRDRILFAADKQLAIEAGDESRRRAKNLQEDFQGTAELDEDEEPFGSTNAPIRAAEKTKKFDARVDAEIAELEASDNPHIRNSDYLKALKDPDERRRMREQIHELHQQVGYSTDRSRRMGAWSELVENPNTTVEEADRFMAETQDMPAFHPHVAGQELADKLPVLLDKFKAARYKSEKAQFLHEHSAGSVWNSDTLSELQAETDLILQWLPESQRAEARGPLITEALAAKLQNSENLTKQEVINQADFYRSDEVKGMVGEVNSKRLGEAANLALSEWGVVAGERANLQMARAIESFDYDVEKARSEAGVANAIMKEGIDAFNRALKNMKPGSSQAMKTEMRRDINAARRRWEQTSGEFSVASGLKEGTTPLSALQSSPHYDGALGMLWTGYEDKTPQGVEAFVNRYGGVPQEVAVRLQAQKQSLFESMNNTDMRAEVGELERLQVQYESVSSALRAIENSGYRGTNPWTASSRGRSQVSNVRASTATPSTNAATDEYDALVASGVDPGQALIQVATKNQGEAVSDHGLKLDSQVRSIMEQLTGLKKNAEGYTSSDNQDWKQSGDGYIWNSPVVDMLMAFQALPDAVRMGMYNDMYNAVEEYVRSADGNLSSDAHLNAFAFFQSETGFGETSLLGEPRFQTWAPEAMYKQETTEMKANLLLQLSAATNPVFAKTTLDEAVEMRPHIVGDEFKGWSFWKLNGAGALEPIATGRQTARKLLGPDASEAEVDDEAKQTLVFTFDKNAFISNIAKMGNPSDVDLDSRIQALSMAILDYEVIGESMPELENVREMAEYLANNSDWSWSDLDGLHRKMKERVVQGDPQAKFLQNKFETDEPTSWWLMHTWNMTWDAWALNNVEEQTDARIKAMNDIRSNKSWEQLKTDYDNSLVELRRTESVVTNLKEQRKKLHSLNVFTAEDLRRRGTIDDEIQRALDNYMEQYHYSNFLGHRIGEVKNYFHSKHHTEAQ